ncbi:MAG TPA: hypothetical protein VFW98_10140 [Gemmatimonadaceae bacterium]|nr:hypothetical protein [Gemmatimonadaceae bacterium]
MLLFVLARCASGGTTRPATAPPPAPVVAAPPPAPVVHHEPIAKLAMGEAAVIVNARPDSGVEVAVSAPGGDVVLEFAPDAVDQWGATTTKILSSRARSRRGRAVESRSTLTEPGVVAGAVTFTRRVRRRAVTYTLFFANRNFGGFPVQVTKNDARVFVGTLRRAAAAARAMQRPAADTAVTPPDTTSPPDTTAPRAAERDALRVGASPLPLTRRQQSAGPRTIRLACACWSARSLRRRRPAGAGTRIVGASHARRGRAPFVNLWTFRWEGRNGYQHEPEPAGHGTHQRAHRSARQAG